VINKTTRGDYENSLGPTADLAIDAAKNNSADVVANISADSKPDIF